MEPRGCWRLFGYCKIFAKRMYCMKYSTTGAARVFADPAMHHGSSRSTSGGSLHLPVPCGGPLTTRNMAPSRTSGLSLSAAPLIPPFLISASLTLWLQRRRPCARAQLEDIVPGRRRRRAWSPAARLAKRRRSRPLRRATRARRARGYPPPCRTGPRGEGRQRADSRAHRSRGGTSCPPLLQESVGVSQ